MSTFIRGIGGFGYKGKQGPPIPAPPNRKPCKVIEEKTSPNQAIIYRLSGDYNPLHIDQVAPIQIIQ
jgi:acyl dehydratase